MCREKDEVGKQKNDIRLSSRSSEKKRSGVMCSGYVFKKGKQMTFMKSETMG